MNPLARASAAMRRFSTIVRTHGAGELVRRAGGRLRRLLSRDPSRVGVARGPVPRLRGRRIVVVDEHLPMPDRDGGSARMRAILDLLCANGWAPAFVPLDERMIEPYASALLRDGIAVARGVREAERSVREAETVWISRPEAARRWMARAREINPGARIVYDTVDVHHVREARRDAVLGTAGAVEATRAMERAAIAAADVVVAVSGVEAALLAGEAQDVVVVPTPYAPVEDPPGRASRSGMLFVGSFDHAPNVDAVDWLAREILPHLAGYRVAVVGSNPPPAVRRLHGGDVEVRGYVPDLDATLRAARVALAPLRYGAGLKAKVVQALAYGLPVIATSVAAEGFDGAALEAMHVEDDPVAFARAAATVYEDEARWERMAAAARAAARDYAPSAALEAVLRAVDGSAAGGTSST